MKRRRALMSSSPWIVDNVNLSDPERETAGHEPCSTADLLYAKGPAQFSKTGHIAILCYDAWMLCRHCELIKPQKFLGLILLRGVTWNLRIKVEYCSIPCRLEIWAGTFATIGTPAKAKTLATATTHAIAATLATRRMVAISKKDNSWKSICRCDSK